VLVVLRLELLSCYSGSFFLAGFDTLAFALPPPPYAKAFILFHLTESLYNPAPSRIRTDSGLSGGEAEQTIPGENQKILAMEEVEMRSSKPMSRRRSHMKHCLISGFATVAFAACAISPAIAQDVEGTKVDSALNAATTVHQSLVKMPQGSIVVPASSVRPTTNGTTLKTRLASTNILLYVPEGGWKPLEASPPRPDSYPPYAGYAYETPESLACIYSLVTTIAGCNPNTATNNPSGGSKSIAIVDAYDDPWAGPDLAYFSSQFGLPFTPEQLTVVYQTGTEPPIDATGGWELEESLDLEYSHAMAPNAHIYLVEANSNYYSDLLASVQIASNLIHCGSTTTCPTTATGKGEVSMSWGGGEFSTETSYDSYFTTPGVVYFASSGDGPGTIWPSTSPNVVAAGGTTLRHSPSTGNFIDERAWDSGGGGVSLYEKIPSYQSSIASIVGTYRGVPDVSFDANPITGVWVWDSNYFEEDGGGWFIVGGTSVSSPSLAGIVNRAGNFAASSNAELTTIYKNMAVTTDFNDITLGWCGPYGGYLAVTSWDPCTGVGSDHGYSGK
jgi:kumamolisin